MDGKRFNPTPPKKPPRESPNCNHDSKAASLQQPDPKRSKTNLWPEFIDIDSEKWDAANKGKDVGKQKSPVSAHFDDPDGKIEMPPSMTVDSWKRPNEVYTAVKNLVVVDTNCLYAFDLITANEHLHDSEVMRHIISQIIILWENSILSEPRQEAINDQGTQFVTYYHGWRPWEHIYALCKSGKGAHMPLYNPHGKYIVRLYFMGCWRKITIDDTLPYNKKGKMLLPTTTQPNELWPMLLTKALIKIAALDYRNRGDCNEFNDFNVLHCLTGWHPEIVPIMSSNASKIWNLLTKTLPEWNYNKVTQAPIIPKRELEERKKTLSTSASSATVANSSKPTVGIKKRSTKHKSSTNQEVPNSPKEEKQEKESFSKQLSAEKIESRAGTSKDKAKVTKDAKDKDKKDKLEKDKSKDKTPVEDEKKKNSTKDEVIMFATYWAPCCPTKVSMLGEMASASERLRQLGLSYLHPHPVWLTQTRSIPLERPTPPEEIPKWKLIRPKKKKTTPSDEPIVSEEVPPIKSLELASAFLSYKIIPIPIPSATTRSKSQLERGGGRSRPSTAHPIEETDETIDLETSDTENNESTTEEKDPSTLVTLEDENTEAASSVVSIPIQPVKSLTKKKSPNMSKHKSSKLENGVDQKKNSSDGSLEKINATSPPNIAEQGSLLETEDKTAPKKDDETEFATRLSTVPEVTGPKKTWIDYEQFCTCFKVLYIYHKPTMYQHTTQVSDFMSSVISPLQAKMTHMQMPSGISTSEDKSTQYLFIDSLQSTEIVVSFSSLSRWNETPQNPQKDQNPKVKESESSASPNHSASSPQQEQASVAPLIPGNLAAEPYSWKSLVIGCPVLKLRTTAVRSAVLSLPPGRHVLRFIMTSPLGYSIHLLSATPFVFGDEETVMALCTKESCRFIDNATQVILSLGNCMKNFSEKNEFEKELRKFEALHCPFIDDRQISKVNHFEAFNEALFSALRVTSLKQEVLFALRALIFDTTSKNIREQLRSRPTTATSSINAPGLDVDKNSAEEASVEDHIAAIKLQKCWRGGFVRKIRDARKHGTPENLRVWDILKQYWSQIELNAEEIGLDLFRTLFKKEPSLMSHYEFYKDEWNKIAYADYQGIYPDHPPETWCVIFREIFMVTEEMMVVPKLYIPIKTCFLRVIDNDTGKEIPRIFKNVSPAVYHRNKRGYTFVAEAHSMDQPIMAGRWRVRLIGSLSPLPAPLKNEVNSLFYVNETKDYYIPSETSTFFMNYTVKVQDDHLATIQMSTSKPDAQFLLSVLDNGSVIYQVEGKGHAVLPAVIFFKDPIDEETISLSSSKESLVGKPKGPPTPNQEPNPLTGSTMQMEDESERKPHKYQIQASILRDSWPLIPADWQFVMSLKDNLKNELKVDYKEISSSPSLRQEKATPAQPPPKLKIGKKSKEAKENKECRPPSKEFEFNRPHWILRVVSDSNNADGIEVRRDTSRAEEIRQLKKAWEDAEPGRAAKATQSRLKYLNTHLVKVEAEKELMEETMADQTPTNTPPNALVKEKVPLIDITPYLKDDDSVLRYVDEELINQRQIEKQEKLHEYHRKRETAKHWMKKELDHLRFSKVQQLETCRQMQLEMDLARENFNRKREDYRRKAIEEETASLAAAAAALAAKEVEAKS